jgi:hypothetical protein
MTEMCGFCSEAESAKEEVILGLCTGNETLQAIECPVEFFNGIFTLLHGEKGERKSRICFHRERRIFHFVKVNFSSGCLCLWSASSWTFRNHPNSERFSAFKAISASQTLSITRNQTQ